MFRVTYYVYSVWCGELRKFFDCYHRDLMRWDNPRYWVGVTPKPRKEW
jgi:hypothetical protein